MITQEETIQRYHRTHPRSAALFEEAQRVFPSGVTHDVRYLGPFPIYIDHASGAHKWDVDGNEYIDYWMGHGALLLGHSHPAITEAVSRQVARGTHYGASHELEIRWGERVQQLIPSAERVKFLSSGTEATLMALRLARAYTNRTRIVKLQGHFHGWHDYATVGYMPPYDQPVSAGVPEAATATVTAVPAGDLEAMAAELAAADVAGVILEPSGASYGQVALPEGYLQGVRELTRQHGTVLIFDEVVTGFRYSTGGVQKLVGVTPDLTSLAKILAGGLPGGAVAGRREILEIFAFTGDPARDRRSRISHPGTFNANPLSAAAGTTMLEIAGTGEPQQHATRLADRARAGMQEAIRSLGVGGGCVYGDASIFHFLLGVGEPGARSPINDPGQLDALTLRMGLREPLKTALAAGLRDRGIDLMGGHAGFVSAAHTEEDIDRTIAAFRATLLELREEGILD